jgi:hypothetical protein
VGEERGGVLHERDGASAKAAPRPMKKSRERRRAPRSTARRRREAPVIMGPKRTRAAVRRPARGSGEHERALIGREESARREERLRHEARVLAKKKNGRSSVGGVRSTELAAAAAIGSVTIFIRCSLPRVTSGAKISFAFPRLHVERRTLMSFFERVIA